MKTIKQIADEIGESKQRVYRYVLRHNIPAAGQDAKTWLYDEDAEQQIMQGIAKANAEMKQPRDTPHASPQTANDVSQQNDDVNQIHINDVHQDVGDSHLNHVSDSTRFYDDVPRSIDYAAIIDQLNKSFDVLNQQLVEKDKQLAEKDKQIHELNDRIGEAHALLDQQQQLQLHSMSKTQNVIEGQVEDVAESAQENSQSQDSDPGHDQAHSQEQPSKDCQGEDPELSEDGLTLEELDTDEHMQEITYKQGFFSRIFGRK